MSDNKTIKPNLKEIYYTFLFIEVVVFFITFVLVLFLGNRTNPILPALSLAFVFCLILLAIFIIILIFTRESVTIDEGELINRHFFHVRKIKISNISDLKLGKIKSARHSSSSSIDIIQKNKSIKQINTDIYSVEDLNKLVEKLKTLNKNIKVSKELNNFLN